MLNDDPQLTTLHLDRETAKASEVGRILANGTFPSALMIDLSMNDTTLDTLIANLGYDKLVRLSPVFIGDTMRATSEVLDLKNSKSRPSAGIVTFQHELINQRDQVVCCCLALGIDQTIGGVVGPSRPAAIVEKEIDVVAFTVIDLQHQRRAAAEAPGGGKADLRLRVADYLDGDVEKGRPFTWPSFRHRSGRQRQRIARQLGKRVRYLAHLGRIHTHIDDELLLRGKRNFGEEGEHRPDEVACALRVGDHCSELMRGEVRSIRRVDRRQHLRAIRHHLSLTGIGPDALLLCSAAILSK